MNGFHIIVSLLLASLLPLPAGCKTTQRTTDEPMHPAAPTDSDATSNPSAPTDAGAATDSAASAPADNDELRGMFETDQGERMVQGEIDWAVLSRKDAERRARVDKMVAAGRVRTGSDYFHAAMVFQHGMTPADYEKAHNFAKKAVELGCTNSAAKWLVAATWDRWQMSRGLPQWYGTQFRTTRPDGPLELYTLDETAVTDEDRKALGVPTLAETREWLAQQNAEQAAAQSRPSGAQD